ncbi:hemerythrin domain-containing protein [Lacibacter sp. MH-610]|uniref:hemerythrin domain-containing protein n=1 Tax=Lacibacter sp. MH-610 TaxID=3020883 RepID=UPI0038913719
MKRDTNLQPLSRQHHNALMAVLLLKKGVQKKAEVQVMQDFILTVWKDELQTHFEAEEKWLPAATDEPVLKSIHERMLQEHEVIRNYIYQFYTTLTSHQTIQTFYELLEQHVRFEEREYFPALEQSLTSDALASIGQHLIESDAKSCADFPVNFWE